MERMAPEKFKAELLHGEIGGSAAVENSIDEVGNTMMTCVKIRSVSIRAPASANTLPSPMKYSFQIRARTTNLKRL